MSTEVAESKTPEQWCAELHARGVFMSARTLRAKAREYGQFLALGRALLLHEKHIEAIFQEETCRLKSISEANSGGSADASKHYRAANTTDKARIKLRKLAQERL